MLALTIRCYFKMEYIPVFSPWIDEEDINEVSKNLRAGNISGTSPVVEEFEREIALMAGTKYSVAVANGSIALDLAFHVLRLSPGDEVIVPSFTIVSCLNAILRAGAVPVFVDCDSTSWNMNVDQVLEVITPKTKAILAVHIYGLTCQVQQLAEIANYHKIVLIEDCAEAHGQSLAGQKIGSFGLMSTFSFYANKHVTTGEGGAVCTSDIELFQKLRKFRNLAFEPQQRFLHFEQGWNYRIGGLQAALGISQLRKLGKIVTEKKLQALRYQERLSKIPNLQLPAVEFDGSSNHYWVYGIVLQNESLAEKLTKFLRENNIETRPFFWPLHEQPLLKNFVFSRHQDLHVSSEIARRGIYLPMGSHLTIEIQDYICTKIEEFLNE